MQDVRASLAVPIVLEEASVRGHTDATRYKKGATYTNWELSADRANASRTVITEAGMPAERINNVMGKADTEPFVLDNPLDPQNRRITLLLLKEDTSLQSPVSMLFYEFYEDLEKVKDYIDENADLLQCVVCKEDIVKKNTHFGETQKPQLWDYADNVDTIEFLTSI